MIYVLYSKHCFITHIYIYSNLQARNHIRKVSITQPFRLQRTNLGNLHLVGAGTGGIILFGLLEDDTFERRAF